MIPSMTRTLSHRGDVPPFYAMELLKLANRKRESGADVISLCLGQPCSGAPAAVRNAARSALASGSTLGYTDANGLPELRAEIARHYASGEGVEVDPARVLVTTGSSAGFTAVILAAFETGDEVAMARPGYPAYRNVLTSLGARVLDLDCGPESRFQPTVDMLAALRRSGAPCRLSPTELFSTLMVTSGTMTHRLKRLETRGFIERVPNAQDARSMLVQLTPAGLALIDRAVPAHVENERRMLSALHADVLAQLDAHLSTLLRSLEEPKA